MLNSKLRSVMGSYAKLTSRRPDLIKDDCHHEEKVNSKPPEHREFGTFKVPTGNKMLLRPNQLIVFERR